MALAGTPPAVHAQRPGEPITLNFSRRRDRGRGPHHGRDHRAQHRGGPAREGHDEPQHRKAGDAPAAYNQFLATLRLSGYTVVEAGGIYKVVPEADAKLQGGAVQTGPVGPGGSQIVTQIFRLSYESANNLVPILRPLISPNNTINVNPGNNSLVITDYADNLQRLGRIISALDVSNATDVEILPLKHAIASDLAPLVVRLIESGNSGTLGARRLAGQADTSFRTTVVAEPRSNTLIVRAANPARLNLVRALVERLDQPTAQTASGNIYVVYLKNADAAKLAVTLRAALSANTGSGALGGGGGGAPITRAGHWRRAPVPPRRRLPLRPSRPPAGRSRPTRPPTR
jgi:general secretion pathway protein D